MTAPTAQIFLTAMRSYLGVIENPLGSNRTRVGVEFGWNGVQWCAETTSVAARRAGWGRSFWSASTDQWESNARRGVNGARWVPGSSTPKPGDCAIWDYARDGTANHISVVESVRADGKLVTIGGNENHRCQRAVRSKYALRGYVRLPFRIPATTTTRAHPSIKPGDQGPAVAEWQKKLNAVGKAGLVVDGKFGDKTKQATINFKRYFKLISSTSTDANVGPKTWATMDYVYANTR